MREYEHQCVESVVHYEFGWPEVHRCHRDGSVERNGKWYCKTHDPVAIDQRYADKQTIWKQKSDKEYEIFNRQNAEHKACEGIPTEALEEGVIQEMVELCKVLVDDRNSKEVSRGSAIDILVKLAEKEQK